MQSVLPADGSGPASADGGAHVLVVNVPMQGHVMPTLGLVEELVGRGHRVTYAVTEDYAPQVQAVGARPVLYEQTRESRGQASEDLGQGAQQAVGQSLAALPGLRDQLDADRPDIVLYDVYAWAGAMLAALWDVPAVQLATSHLPYRGLVRDMFGVDDIREIPGYGQLEAALAAHNVPGGVHALTLSPSHAIAFLPRAFQRYPDTVTAGQAHYVGPVLANRSFQGHWEPPTGNRPILLISLGTQFCHRPEFYRACAEAFSTLDWHVVMACGTAAVSAELGRLPGNFEVHRSVPQLNVLAHAGAFITHGGMGSTLEALAHDVPLVAVPQMAEQRVNAAQIAELHLGVHLPREEATAAALRAAVLRVTTDDTIAAGVRAMQAHIAESGGAPAAADVVERMLQRAQVTTA
jgi:MGT family glycosyltransferase